MSTELRGPVLAANTATWASSQTAQALRQRRAWGPTVWLVGMVATAAITLAVGTVLRPDGQLARPAPVAPTQAADTDSTANNALTGSRIVESPCLEVGAAQCLDADPRLKAPIELLRGTGKGPDLLKTTAGVRVRIRAGTAPPGALAAYRYRSRMVTLDTRLLNFSARAQAAILAHELRHVVDWSKLGSLVANNPLTCYGTEANAFQTEAAVWTELRGTSGPSDRLEQEVEAMTQGVEHGGAGFWLSLGGDYLDECA